MKKLKIIVCIIFFSSLFSFCEGQYTVLLNFNDTNGNSPVGSLIFYRGALYGMTCYGGTFGNGVIFSLHADGSGYKELLNFVGVRGANPLGTLVAGDSLLYGMTLFGGTDNQGIIFSIDTNGTKFNPFHNFNILPPNGEEPFGSLTLVGNVLYGMASLGGSIGSGCIFSIHTDGSSYKTLFNFNNDLTTGANPFSSLIFSNGVLYGMTGIGGMDDSGTIFSIDTNGSNYKTLFNFSNNKYGSIPQYGSLTISGNVLYGMTYGGGKKGVGCIFSIHTDGSNIKDLFNFNGTLGSNPYGSLTLSGNVLYGMATYGGAYNYSGCIFSIDTNGSNYKDLLDFNAINGGWPFGSLTISGDTLFGMTSIGGTNNIGVVFSFKDTAIHASTGINTINYTSSIAEYPNPSNGQFNFVIASSAEGGMWQSQSTIEVYNELGEQVSTLTLPSPSGEGVSGRFQINLSAQPNGIYFYRVISKDGSLVGDGKLVIAR